MKVVFEKENRLARFAIMVSLMVAVMIFLSTAIIWLAPAIVTVLKATGPIQSGHMK